MKKNSGDIFIKLILSMYKYNSLANRSKNKKTDVYLLRFNLYSLKSPLTLNENEENAKNKEKINVFCISCSHNIHQKWPQWLKDDYQYKLHIRFSKINPPKITKKINDILKKLISPVVGVESPSKKCNLNVEHFLDGFFTYNTFTRNIYYIDFKGKKKNSNFGKKVFFKKVFVIDSKVESGCYNNEYYWFPKSKSIFILEKPNYGSSLITKCSVQPRSHLLLKNFIHDYHPDSPKWLYDLCF